MPDTLYTKLGGAPAITALVDSFYAHMNHLPAAQTIRALHPADLTRTKHDLALYLTEWTGGPAGYTPIKGHPRMRQRHMHVPIGTAEAEAWMLCMTSALAATIADPAAREAILPPLAKLADWMRNRPD